MVYTTGKGRSQRVTPDMKEGANKRKGYEKGGRQNNARMMGEGRALKVIRWEKRGEDEREKRKVQVTKGNWQRLRKGQH